MKIRTVKYFFRDGFRGIIRNRVMSMASITTVAAALFVLGIFLVMVVNVNKIMGNVENSIEIKAFLKDNVTTVQQQQSIESQIKALSGVTNVQYESKEEALQKFKSELGANKDLANGLESQNPLPASFIVKVQKPELVKDISGQISKISGIDELQNGQDYIDKLLKVADFVKVAGLVLMIVLGTISIFLISNTIKLAVYSRKREIGIMKYIGATDWFIRWPFVIEGVLLGLVGALLSAVILSYGYSYVAQAVTKGVGLFSLVPPEQIINTITWEFILIGMAIGGLGSFVSLRKFLAV